MSKLSSDRAKEGFSQYVAELQLHMSLQARNLVPSLTQNTLTQAVVGSREQLLHQTQATIEKLVSRQ